jgi:uncharacterized protein (DUF305 family)
MMRAMALVAVAAMAAVSPSAAQSETSPADVAFMQGMIAHHGQALEMVALIPGRTARPDFQLLGERIGVSQRDEIGMMQRWLRAHGAEVPDSASAHAHMAMGHGMPGMLTPQEMAQLAASSGAAFERLFLSGMIRHHQGALSMVGQLFATRGGGQESEVFRFATDVDADQRAEIARMQSLLAALASPQAAH